MVEYHPQLDPGHRRFEKIWNTYVRVSLPWARTLRAEYWETRAIGEAHGPHQFVELQESSHIVIDEVVRIASGPTAPVLDLGCNVGRHLNALHQRGFSNLYGVDVQKAALEHMGRVFPEMAAKAHIEQGTFQEYLPKVPDKFFEVVFTFGATIELVQPSFPVCRHMARTAARAVVLKINESGHTYPRLWETEFSREGFRLTKLLRPVAQGDWNSLLVFERVVR
jgi:2-polyprenyl-3-methyl-5-hydroxy-6-metoxy-1,4-benzoquinol methylase